LLKTPLLERGWVRAGVLEDLAELFLFRIGFVINNMDRVIIIFGRFDGGFKTGAGAVLKYRGVLWNQNCHFAVSVTKQERGGG